MTKNLTVGNPAKLIILFAIPIILGNLFQQLYSMADTMIVGRTISLDALAAVGSTGSITFLIIGFMQGFASGLSIITSQEYGAQNEDRIKKSFAASIILGFSLSIILVLIAVPCTRPLLEIMQTPANIIDDAYIYLVIIFLGMPATMLFNLMSNVMRALGNSRAPLFFLILASFVNIILDLVFILFFGMGVDGAAWATIISQLFSGVCCCIYIKYRMPILHLQKEHFRMDLGFVMEHIKVAFPMGFQLSIISIGEILLQVALNKLGSTAVAAITAAYKIEFLTTIHMGTLGNAMATYAAQNYGAKKYNRIRQGVNQCLLISVGWSLAVGIVNMNFGREMAEFFLGTSNSEILTMIQSYLTITSMFYWSLSLLFVYRFTLQGLGKQTAPTLSGIAELVMRVICVFTLAPSIGFTGICLTGPAAWVGACVPLAIAYYYNIRKLPRE